MTQKTLFSLASKIFYSFSAASHAVFSYLTLVRVKRRKLKIIKKITPYPLGIMFKNKYNVNPAAASRLGAKHTEEAKAWFSKLRRENPHFLNKVHSEDIIEQLRIRMTGSSNPMYGKPVTEANKKLISD